MHHFLSPGNADIKFPGLHEPISFDTEGRRDKRQYDTGGDRKGRDERGPRLQTARERGWAGTTWPGRHAGCPQMANGGKDDVIRGQLREASIYHLYPRYFCAILYYKI